MAQMRPPPHLFSPQSIASLDPGQSGWGNWLGGFGDMRHLVKSAAAFVLGAVALGLSAASADDKEKGYRGDDDGYEDGRGDDRYDGGRYDDRRYSDYRGGRPEKCDIDHDHRYHSRNYYDYYPRDRYYDADPGFSVSLSFGDRGYYDRGGRYDDRYYYYRRGYRDHGRLVNRQVYRLRGYRADAILVEEVYYGRRGGSDLICTVTARGPDARYVPYGQLRRIATRECSRRADIRIYA
jgi:hypothetical protein